MTPPDRPTPTELDLVQPRENVYGSRKRIDWLAKRIARDQPVVDFGCGTGALVAIPLLMRGFDLYGIDLDSRSIEFGQSIAVRNGLSAARLQAIPLAALDVRPGTIIASEVLEHIPDNDLIPILNELRAKLGTKGTLLVTVPNGYGWFEIESALWYRLGAGRLLERLKVDRFMDAVRRFLLGHTADDPYPNTLADDASPHVQRFTMTSVRALLERTGFEVVEATGSVLLAGPFTNLFFRGIPPLLSVNCWLGDRFPVIASGFYLRCRVASGSRPQ